MKQTTITAIALFLMTAGIAFPADFDGDSRDDIAIFRPAAGMWAIRGVTRVYFGGSADTPAAGDYTGDGIAEIGVFRKTAGMWAIRGVSRIYFGGSSDTAVGGGGGQRLYDYVVRPDDGADLERALESASYDSVFIPAGTYSVSDPITITHVTQITGESRQKVIIFFAGGKYLAIGSAATGCTIEKITVQNGGFTNIGNFFIAASDVTVRDCSSRYSAAEGFRYTSGANSVIFDNCRVDYAGGAGFHGDVAVRNSKLINCAVFDTGTVDGSDIGFQDCHNLSNCYVDGEYYGYYQCNNISSSVAYNCFLNGFWECGRLSSCEVDGNNQTTYAFYGCDNLASCHVKNSTYYYQSCDYFFGSLAGHENSCD